MARDKAQPGDSQMEEKEKPKLSRESLRELWLIFRYVKPYRRQFVSGLLFISLSSATTMAFPSGFASSTN